MRSSLKPGWIAIAILAILFTVMTVQACTPVPSLKATTTGAVSDGSTGSLHLHYVKQESTCTREEIEQCKYVCTMHGGMLDLYCYEDCISSVC